MLHFPNELLKQYNCTQEKGFKINDILPIIKSANNYLVYSEQQ